MVPRVLRYNYYYRYYSTGRATIAIEDQLRWPSVFKCRPTAVLIQPLHRRKLKKKKLLRNLSSAVLRCNGLPQPAGGLSTDWEQTSGLPGNYPKHLEATTSQPQPQSSASRVKGRSLHLMLSDCWSGRQSLVVGLSSGHCVYYHWLLLKVTRLVRAQ